MTNTWNRIDQLQEGDLLTLRGYIYRSKEGHFILSDTPDLKSCCVGVSHKLDTQLKLLADDVHPNMHVPYDVKGRFHFSPKMNESGILVEKYSLSEVSIAPAQKSHFLSISVGVILFLFLLRKVLKRFRFKRECPLLP